MKDLIRKVLEYICKPFTRELPLVEEIEEKPKKKKRIRTGRKLDCKVIIWCRDQYKKGESIRSLAKKMDVADTTLLRAIKGESYKECKGK